MVAAPRENRATLLVLRNDLESLLAALMVAIAFTVYTVSGGAFSWRTPGALLLRFGFWVAIAWGLFRNTQPTDRDA